MAKRTYNYNKGDREVQIAFYVEIRIPAFWTECPDGMECGKCPMRPHLVHNKVFIWDAPDHIAIPAPNTKKWTQARDEIDKMYAICENCKKQNSSGR